MEANNVGRREGGRREILAGQLDFITSFSLLQIEVEIQVFPTQKICVASFLVSHQAYNVCDRRTGWAKNKPQKQATRKCGFSSQRNPPKNLLSLALSGFLSGREQEKRRARENQRESERVALSLALSLGLTGSLWLFLSL